MTLAVGTTLGAYEVLSLLGAGGMGEVYRARDMKLHRDVALKVLPEFLAADPERRARFEREAQVLASLNHPNIAQIHGFEDSGDVRALVMELVDGPTLANRIAQGPIPLSEALPIAKQIADALEAAHEQGIIHRDLKPANIKVRPDGTVKVLDFGLAKALDPVSAAASATMSPTLSLQATQAGVILGTAAYMSPEQAKGRPVDKRTDVWAFGCVLYEMLTGQRAFEGEDISEVFASVLAREPKFDALPRETPEPIRRLLRRCIERDHRRRLPDVSIARYEFDALAEHRPEAAADPPSTRRRARPRFGLGIGAGVLIGGLLALPAGWLLTTAAPPRVIRTSIVPPPDAMLRLDGVAPDVAVSADGSRVAYVGTNGTTIFVRALDQLEPLALRDLGAPRYPVFSPDGRWIAFVDENTTLKKVPVTGGPAVVVTQMGSTAFGLSWGAPDSIVFATADTTTGLMRVNAAGGVPEVLTKPDGSANQGDHHWPEMLPDNKGILFTLATTGRGERDVAVLDASSGKHRVLVRGGSHARYVAPGYLVYAMGGTLMGVRFDLGRLETVGTPVPVIDGLAARPFGAANVSVGADGTLVYVSGEAVSAGQRTLVWADRQGREESLGAPPRAYVYPRLSQDAKQLVVFAADEEQDLWLWEFGRKQLTRLTFHPAIDLYPLWSLDGRLLIWASQRGAGPFNLFAQPADGTGTAERLLASPLQMLPTTVTPDGKGVIVRVDGGPGGGGGVDVVLVSLDGKRSVTPLVATPATERNGDISPDGRWLAYESDESGRFEIYVRPFPNVDAGKWQVSRGGGTRAIWARKGGELFYRGLDGAVMAVTVETEGVRFRAGDPVKLVEGKYFGASGTFQGRTYDVAPDGSRFLMIKEGSTSTDRSSSPTIVVVQNWPEELKRRIPAN